MLIYWTFFENAMEDIIKYVSVINFSMLLWLVFWSFLIAVKIQFKERVEKDVYSKLFELYKNDQELSRKVDKITKLSNNQSYQ